MKPSTSVVLDNVDDYLAPSQACINPLFQPPKHTEEIESKQKKVTKIVPRRRRRRAPISDERKPSPTTDAASGSKPGDLSHGKKWVATTVDQKIGSVVKASIADCLACSGCVTTAETILLEQRHSLQSLREKLQSSQGRFRAITISPNSWADMCRHWDLYSTTVPKETTSDWEENGDVGLEDSTRLQFATLMKKILKADIVVDGNLPLQWTWLEEAQELVELYHERRGGMEDTRSKKDEECECQNRSKAKDCPLPSTAVDATKSVYYYPDGTSGVVDNTNDEHDTTSLPLISGSCPATVCLVETSRPELVPHLSRTQSPMSMMGSILKNRQELQKSGDDRGNSLHDTPTAIKTPSDAWDHWAIMPCHDKKLEASRQDFVLPHPKRSLVDLVITTSECVELVEEFVQLKKEEGSHNDEWTVASYLQRLPVAKKKVIARCNDVPDRPYAETTYLTTIGSSSNTRNRSSFQGSLPFAFSSGSHANFLFLYAARELFGCALDKVEWKAAAVVQDVNKNDGDNSKIVIKSARLARAQKQHYFKAQLYRLKDGGYSQAPPPSQPQSPVLDFSIAHGMQTMQRALKELEDFEPPRDGSNVGSKSGSADTLRYLEAMACPHGGCINGGGAIATRNTSNEDEVRESPTEMRQRIQNSLHNLEVPPQPSVDALMTKDSSQALSGSSQETFQSSNWRRTRYHVVPEMKHTFGATAGVKVADIQW